jgi:hypothetical protein
VRSGSAIVLLLVTAAFAAPSAAGAKVTREDRAFAHAFEHYDAAARAALANRASLAALHARQKAGAGCVDVVRSVVDADRREHTAHSLDALIFYEFHAIDPFADAANRVNGAYLSTLRRMHLHDPTLRAARAVLILLIGVEPLSHDVLADFCGPMRAWQAAGFAQASRPAQIKAASDLFDRAPKFNERRRATLGKALVRLRAAGMPRAARQSFVQAGQVDSDKLLRGDPVLPAFRSQPPPA